MGGHALIVGALQQCSAEVIDGEVDRKLLYPEQKMATFCSTWASHKVVACMMISTNQPVPPSFTMDTQTWSTLKNITATGERELARGREMGTGVGRATWTWLNS